MALLGIFLGTACSDQERRDGCERRYGDETSIRACVLGAKVTEEADERTLRVACNTCLKEFDPNLDDLEVPEEITDDQMKVLLRIQQERMAALNACIQGGQGYLQAVFGMSPETIGNCIRADNSGAGGFRP